MRSFSKKLAFVLAAAMVVTSFAPAAKAEAAKEMAINKSSQILYVNEGINHKGADGVAAGKGNVSVYDFSVKNKPADWKDTLNFKWSTSDDEVVTVKAGGVATAVGVGKATITCKVTDKATKETVATLKTKITVKANAADVEITNADDVAGLAYEVGATVDLNRAMYDEDGNKTTKRGKLVTDYTRWIAEPSTGVTIDQKSGKYTFAEAGEYTLYCETYQSSKYTKATATSDKVKVTIAAGLELKQTTRTKFEINLAKATDLKIADVTVDKVVVGAGDKVYTANCLVKGVTMSNDNKTATVELFYDFEDGIDYEITVKGYDKETFTASVGTPKKILLHTEMYNQYGRTVVKGVESPIYYRLYDANDIDVTKWNADQAAGVADYNANMIYKIKYVGSDYESTANSLYFAESGQTALVVAEYHSYEYDDNNQEKDVCISETFTFVAVNKPQTRVQAITAFSAVDGDFDAPDKDIVRLNEDVFGDNKVNDFVQELTVQVILSDATWKKINLTKFGQQIVDNSGDYLGDADFTSLNPDVLDVRANVANKSIELYPRKEGVARILVSYVTDVNGVDVRTNIGIVDLKVQGKRVMTSVSWNNANVVLSTAPADASLVNPTATLNVVDQYGVNFNDLTHLGKTYVIKEIKGANAVSQELYDTYPAALTVSGDKHSVTFDTATFARVLAAKNKTSLKYFFNVTVEDDSYVNKTVSLAVDARKPDGNTRLSLELENWKVGANGNNVARTWSNDYNTTTERQKDVAFSLFKLSNDAKYDVVALKEMPENPATCTPGLYYKINKNGVNIGEYDNVSVSGNKLTVAFNGLRDSQYNNAPGKIAFYDEKWNGVVGGAGNYEFIVYEITANAGADNTVARKLSKSLTVGLDTGNYTLVTRDNVKAASTSNQDLLRCFTFADRSGNLSSYWDVLSNSQVKFGGNDKLTRNYNVNLKEELSKPGSVYVDSVTFWEDASAYKFDPDGTRSFNWDNGGNQTVYAEYTVKVGCYVEIGD